MVSSRQLLLVEEENLMTVQVGLTGNGGIVLASDRRLTAGDVKIGEDLVGYAAYTGKLETKIQLSQEKNIAISCADDFTFARKTAKQIIAELNTCDLTDEYRACSAVERIIKEASSDGGGKAQWLIALKCPDWKLLKCLSVPRESANSDGEWDVSCAPCPGWDFAGEITNPAIFWHKFHNEDMSPKQLVPLAANLILSAHFFNSKNVDGLDIAQCDANGVRLLSSTSIAALEKKSRLLDRKIIESLFADDIEYTYAPQKAEA